MATTAERSPGRVSGSGRRASSASSSMSSRDTASLRAALRDLQDPPATGRVTTRWRSRRSTRRGSSSSTTTRGWLFVTSFDGPWDAYMEDFFTSGPTLALFDVIFQHVEGYEGLPTLPR